MGPENIDVHSLNDCWGVELRKKKVIKTQQSVELVLAEYSLKSHQVSFRNLRECNNNCRTVWMRTAANSGRRVTDVSQGTITGNRCCGQKTWSKETAEYHEKSTRKEREFKGLLKRKA